MKERSKMKLLKRYPLMAALAVALLLSACGADPVETGSMNSPEPEKTHTPLIIDAPTPSADPIESEEPTEEPSSEPSGPVMLEEIVGLIPLCEPVEDSWFADAVFIGDSRTDGLKIYGNIKGATFFSYKGLTVFSVDDKECIQMGDTKVTVLDAMSRGTYGKIFVMLGINEIGYKDLNAFKQAYTDLVIKLKELQPEADIYIQLQPPANESVAKKKGNYTHVKNERIQLFNELIAEVAEEQGTALLDIWDALANEENVLPAELTADGVHMVSSGYRIWVEYLRTHTGTTPLVTEEPEEPPVEEPVEEPVETAEPTPSVTPAPVESVAPSVAPTPAATPTPSTPVVTQPVETAPVESVPVESEPVESVPAESAPVESAPAESAPVESEPVNDDPEAVVSQPADGGTN